MNAILHALRPLDARQKPNIKDFIQFRRMDARHILWANVHDDLSNEKTQDEILTALFNRDDAEIGRLIRESFEHGVKTLEEEGQ